MKETPINRLVGKVSEDPDGVKKNDFEKKLRNTYARQKSPELDRAEREKTGVELTIINAVDAATNSILHSYGLREFNMPPEAVHIIKESEWDKLTDGKGDNVGGFYHPILQGVVLPEDPVRMHFAHRTTHEVLHLKSYNALQIKPEQGLPVSAYRSGISLNKNVGIEMFNTLNEAVIEELAMRCMEDLFRDPVFADEVKQTRMLIKHNKGTFEAQGNLLLSDKEIYFAGIRPLSTREGYVYDIEGNRVAGTIQTYTGARKHERRIFRMLLRKLQEANPKQFKNQEAPFRIFAGAALQGNMLPLRIIDSTFGKGTFRKIGDFDNDLNRLEEFVKNLSPITSSTR